MAPFDQAVALNPLGGDLFEGHTSPAYANFVGPFGGIMAAQALNGVMQHPGRLGEPVSLTVNFCAAQTDGPFTVQARPARTNRSTQHWIVETTQNNEVVLTATVFTATRRDTYRKVEHTMPAVGVPADTPIQGGPKRVEWVNRYEMRFVEGHFPGKWDGSGQASTRSRLWLRDEPPRPLDFCALAAMCDAFFPRVWLHRASFVPIGTVSMTVYFHASSAELAATGTGHLLAQAQGQNFFNGYFDQTAQLWNEVGALLATSHQVVYYKE
jgi:acyl-CoA thioesterase